MVLLRYSAAAGALAKHAEWLQVAKSKVFLFFFWNIYILCIKCIIEHRDSSDMNHLTYNSLHNIHRLQVYHFVYCICMYTVSSI